MAILAGADALGLVGKMPSGPGPIADDLIASISRMIHPPIASFLLTCEQTAEGIIEHVRRVNTNTVQIVDELIKGSYEDIRKALPHLNIVQVIHIRDETNIKEAKEISPRVDAILLDSGDPGAFTKTLGGTGKTHNWDISSEIVRTVKVPVFLAGGLNAGNVGEAIRKVRPFAVDLCSAVRTEGRLDGEKLSSFVAAVHAA